MTKSTYHHGNLREKFVQTARINKKAVKQNVITSNLAGKFKEP